jgi:biopolymer transport protein ExbD
MSKPISRRDQRSAKRAVPLMNVTPLVDVVLVLLIIFMVVIPAMESGAHIELPSVHNVDEDVRGRADPLTLSLRADGQLFFEKESIASIALESRLQREHETDVMRRIVLRADRGVHYQDARKLYVMLQDIGFPGISLQVNERARASIHPGGHAAAR